MLEHPWAPANITHFQEEEQRTEQPFRLLKHMDSTAGIPSRMYLTLSELVCTGRSVWWAQSLAEKESSYTLSFFFHVS